MEAPDNVHRDLRTSFTRAFYTLRYIIQHLPHLRSQFIYLKLEIHEAFVLTDQETVKKYEIRCYLSDIVAITDTAYTWRSMRKGIWGTVPTDANARCVRQLISFGNKFLNAYTTSVLPLHICPSRWKFADSFSERRIPFEETCCGRDVFRDGCGNRINLYILIKQST